MPRFVKNEASATFGKLLRSEELTTVVIGGDGGVGDGGGGGRGGGCRERGVGGRRLEE